MSVCEIIAGSDNAEKAQKNLEEKQIEGIKVVVGSSYQLMIDYDLEEFPQKRFDKGLSFLKQRVDPSSIFFSKYHSKSGKHWHVVVQITIEMSETERLVWQQIFGSDPVRDALSMIGVSRNVKNPILLYMKDGAEAEETGIVSLVKNRRKFKEVS